MSGRDDNLNHLNNFEPIGGVSPGEDEIAAIISDSPGLTPMTMTTGDVQTASKRESQCSNPVGRSGVRLESTVFFFPSILKSGRRIISVMDHSRVRDLE